MLSWPPFLELKRYGEREGQLDKGKKKTRFPGGLLALPTYGTAGAY